MRLPTAISVAAVVVAAATLAGCSSAPRQRVVKTGAITYSTVSLMKQREMDRGAPILMRVFKEEGLLEVWKQGHDGRYALLKTYKICRFSGKLGPKKYEGDKQAPEGFYAISKGSLNPFSRNHLAFNIGFPNAFDKQLGRYGSNIMVHGGCSSVGCFAMTHESINEIYALMREAILDGQDAVPFHSYPFRMTQENLDRHAGDPNMPFWQNLKVGYDLFRETSRPPSVAACGGTYGFAPAGRAGDGVDPCAFAADRMARRQTPAGYGARADYSPRGDYGADAPQDGWSDEAPVR